MRAFLPGATSPSFSIRASIDFPKGKPSWNAYCVKLDLMLE
jgi:hypothetical protein